MASSDIPLVYALSTCPYCRRTRRFLADNGIPYDIVEVDLLDEAEQERVMGELRRLTGGESFPVVIYQGEWMVGHDEARLRRLLGL